MAPAVGRLNLREREVVMNLTIDLCWCSRDGALIKHLCAMDEDVARVRVRLLKRLPHVLNVLPELVARVESRALFSGSGLSAR